MGFHSLRAAALSLTVIVVLGTFLWLLLRFTDHAGPDRRPVPSPIEDPSHSQRPMLRGAPARHVAPAASDARPLAAEEWAAQQEAEQAKEAARRKRSPVFSRLDHLVATVEVDPDNADKRPVASRIERATTTLALLGAGFTHRGGHAYKPWMVRAARLARAEIDAGDLAWMVRTPPPEEAWIADLLFGLGMVELYGMTDSPLFVRRAASVVNSLLASERPDGGYGPGRGTFTSTWLAAMVLKSAELIADARAHRDAAFTSEELHIFDDPELAATAIRRASRFLDSYIGPDGLVQLTGTDDEAWFAHGMVREVEFEDRLGPTAAAYLVQVLAGEDPGRSGPVKRAATWIASRLPGDWREARSQDPLGMYALPLFLYQTSEFGKLRKSFSQGHGRDPLRDDGREAAVEYPLPGSTQDPATWIAFTALSNELFYRYERVYGS